MRTLSQPPCPVSAVGRRDKDAYHAARLWIKGFPRKLLSPHLKAHGVALLEYLPAAVQAGTKINANNMDTKHSIDFTSPGEATDAFRLLRTKDLVWVDRRSEPTKHRPLRISPDRSINARLIVRTLAGLFVQCQSHMRENNISLDGKRLGTTGPRGDLFIANGEDVIELFHVSKTEGADPEIVPNLEGLGEIGVTKTLADAMVVKSIEDARRSAMRR